MKNIVYILFLFVINIQGQVGINTVKPKQTLDVNGRIRSKIIDTLKIDSVVVTSNRLQYKIHIKDLIADYIQTSNNKCPRLNRVQSNEYYVLFDSNSSLPLPNTNITIENLNFTFSGSWTSNNIYYYSWSNSSGIQLNINKNFTVDFNGLTCQY